MGELVAMIDHVWRGVQGIEELAEGLPPPRDPLGERRARDVLHSLHQLHQPVLATCTDRCEPDTAIATDDRCHPMPA